MNKTELNAVTADKRKENVTPAAASDAPTRKARSTAGGGPDLTPDQKEILMVHLVRSEKVLQKVSHLIDPEDFEGEPWFYAIWDLARKHWNEYKRLIGKEHMMSQLRTYVENSPEFVYDEERQQAVQFAAIIFKFPEDQLIEDMGVKLAQLFVDERQVRKIALSDLPVSDLLSQLSA